MKVVKVSEILRRLSEDGWYLVHYRGSHRQFKHHQTTGKVTINGKPSDDITGNLLKSIESQTGLMF